MTEVQLPAASEAGANPAARGIGDTVVGESGAAWNRRYAGALMNTFGTPQRVLVRGEGCHVWDADGNQYLDLLAGIAVNLLGHAHPTLTGAIAAQLATLGHVSNFFATTPQIALAERLLEISGAPEGSRVFLCNSGTEATEGAFKLARRTGRTGMVAAEGGFHGRSMGALALTHKPAYRAPFEPLPGDVVHVPFGDVEALRAAVDERTAAVVLEPVQGEAGAVVPPPGYLGAARQITAAAGALLVLDEVQTGMGRTGSWFAHQHPMLGGPAGPDGGGVRPDVVTLAKGLGGGIPIGAVIASGRAASLLGPGDHGTTFGGNPVAAAAALATLHVIERDGLRENAVRIGRRLVDALGAPAHPQIAGVRGIGLLLGIVLRSPVAVAVRDELLDHHGIIVNAAAPDVLRLAPPLVLTADQADRFVEALPAALDAVLDPPLGEVP